MVCVAGVPYAQYPHHVNRGTVSGISISLLAFFISLYVP
jgi:hypothetical protein